MKKFIVFLVMLMCPVCWAGEIKLYKPPPKSVNADQLYFGIA